MKKLLALVLALIMVLGLGVTAFAVEDIHVITLTKETTTEDDPEEIVALEEGVAGDTDINEKKYLVPEGGDYYVEIANYDGLKNIEVSATGNVTAEIVEFDADTMRYPNAVYGLYDSEGVMVGVNGKKFDGTKAFMEVIDVNWLLYDDVPTDKLANNLLLHYSGTADGKLGTTKTETWKTQDDFKFADGKYDEYSYLEYMADELNAFSKVKKDRFSVVCLKSGETSGSYVKLDKNLLKITVADNYSAAYKEGTVKLAATRKSDKKSVVANLTIISDVTIFEYEELKWAVDNGEALEIGTNGYSDYKTAKGGYDVNGDTKYDPDDLRTEADATVVSTTEFRYAEGEELVLESEDIAKGKPFLTVTIDEVAKGQKGVNFAYEKDIFKYYDEDDEELDPAKDKVIGEVEYFEFGFLGNQVIASDFEIEVKLPWDAFELRELFGKKVEEEDIITYYVLKDGVKIDDFTVDYKDDDIDEKLELEIHGKAGDKLGYYTITLDAPAAEEGEENPNTGAESVVGVVAAMAVVSLVAAAAVSLKK